MIETNALRIPDHQPCMKHVEDIVICGEQTSQHIAFLPLNAPDHSEAIGIYNIESSFRDFVNLAKRRNYT